MSQACSGLDGTQASLPVTTLWGLAKQPSPHFLISDLRMAAPKIHGMYNSVAVVTSTLSNDELHFSIYIQTQRCF